MNESSNLSSLPYNIPNDPLNFLSEDPLDFLGSTKHVMLYVNCSHK